MSTHPALGQWAPLRPSTDRASWTEYQRLLTAGVTPATAALLAAGQPPLAYPELSGLRIL
jgi:hypothetical protein